MYEHCAISNIRELNIEPRSNKHGRKRPYMEKYDEIHGPVLRSVYLRVVYGEIRRYTEKKHGRSIRSSYTISVLLHISAYMIVFLRIRHGDILSVIRAHVKRQNTILYGSIRKRIQSFTGVYGVRNRQPGGTFSDFIDKLNKRNLVFI